MKKQQGTSEETRLRFFGIDRLMPFIRPYGKTIFLMVVLGALSSGADVIFVLFNRYALNHFVAERTTEGLGIFCGLYIALLLLQAWDNYVDVCMCGRIEMYIDRDLRNAAFNHLQTLSFSYFNRNNVGYIHSRVMSDTGRIGEMVAWDLMRVVWTGAYVIFALATMLAINAKLTLYIIALIPAVIAITIYFQRHLIVLNRKVREMNSRITGDFNEGITGARAIKTLVIEDKMTEEFDDDTERMRKLSVHTSRHSALFVSTVSFFSSVALSMVLWKGGRITAEGVMEIGTLSVFMSYALGVLDPLQEIISTVSNLIAVQVNIERLTTLLSTKSDVVDSPEVIERYGDTFSPKKENWEEIFGDMDFEDVTFRYPDGEEYVLEHFNLHVPQGTNVGIVGETGAGKSTLVNLACRFYEPTSGRVLLDGRDLRERSQLWLHSNIGYVLQTPHLFSGSVRDNLRYGKPDATDDEIWDALKLVAADDIVARMEKGLDSMVGEGGDTLSTGEKQLLSFARAIIARPRILVLDEATSSIDTVTERRIQDAIRIVTQGRTAFVIAHRLSTIVDADVILVVKDGHIVEQGRHGELMEARGYYYELYTRQQEQLAADMEGVSEQSGC